MKPPYQENGIRSFMNDAGEKVVTGAQMGRKIQLPDSYHGEALNLHKVEIQDGYDKGGAYWGNGTPLYCAFGDGVEIYVRAKDRTEAKEKARLQTPSWYAKLNWKKVTPWNH